MGEIMIKALIFGTGVSSIVLERVLDNKKVEILAYIDNDESKWGQWKNGVIIDRPQNIKCFNYDYILIASQYNDDIYKQLISFGIDGRRIFQHHNFMDNSNNYYQECINNFLSRDYENTEILVTGISYARTGFSQQACYKKSFNFAWASQDLFYDYETVKYLIENYTVKLSTINYALIGLCYYSFQYDLSLSAFKDKTVLYYSVLKNGHHFKEIERIYSEHEVDKLIALDILRKDQENINDPRLMIPELKDIDNKFELGKTQAERDCNKNYPNTVAENISILKEYLNLLYSNNIKPIIVVYPASKYYTEYFSCRIEQEFKMIIEEFRKEFGFQYIDYFKSDLFYDSDFYDVSHLNWRGAEKFTKILNKIIEW